MSLMTLWLFIDFLDTLKTLYYNTTPTKRVLGQKQRSWPVDHMESTIQTNMCSYSVCVCDNLVCETASIFKSVVIRQIIEIIALAQVAVPFEK